ncbi:MAG: energy-coupling factor transporter transmembrane protein EcfT [Clostridiales bacterium]|nr:energy-coupling factor transporter transmembrane protein EcfT [Clostridiales bacterium]
MPPVKAKSNLFKKDENVLPFFSIHPRTKIGAILRIALTAFMLLCAIATFVAGRTGYTISKYWDYQPLVYIVPIVLIFALIVLALFKRLKTPIQKIIVGVLSAMIMMFIISLASSVMSLWPLLTIQQSGSSAPSPTGKLNLKTDDYSEQLVMLRMFSVPDEYKLSDTVTENGEPQKLYPYRTDCYTYTAKGAEGEKAEVTGSISVDKTSTFKIEPEWVNENTLRYYIAQDSLGTGTGEITVIFPDKAEFGEANPAEKPVSSQTNASGTHSASLFREEGYFTTYQPVYNMSKDSLKKLYTCYLSTFFGFILKMNTRVEGFIEIAPYGELKDIQLSVVSEGVLRVAPAENCVDASGEILIYLNEKATDASGTADSAKASDDAKDTDITDNKDQTGQEETK